MQRTTECSDEQSRSLGLEASPRPTQRLFPSTGEMRYVRVGQGLYGERACAPSTDTPRSGEYQLKTGESRNGDFLALEKDKCGRCKVIRMLLRTVWGGFKGSGQPTR